MRWYLICLLCMLYVRSGFICPFLWNFDPDELFAVMCGWVRWRFRIVYVFISVFRIAAYVRDERNWSGSHLYKHTSVTASDVIYYIWCIEGRKAQSPQDEWKVNRRKRHKAMTDFVISQMDYSVVNWFLPTSLTSSGWTKSNATSMAEEGVLQSFLLST